MTTSYPTDPMTLLGRYFDFVEQVGEEFFPPYKARVIAIQVPCPGTDIPLALLLERTDSYPDAEPEYVALQNLSFDWS